MSINIRFSNKLKVSFSIYEGGVLQATLPAGTSDTQGGWHNGSYTYTTSGDTPYIQLSANPSPNCQLIINSASVSITTDVSQPNLIYTFALSKTGALVGGETDVNVTVGANQP